MTRETILATLISCWAFRRKHPLIGIFFSLLIIAACAGGIYLIITQLSSFALLPCFTDGCGN
ncbi:MAG: hypothetical protein AAB359_01705 [Elusimicrobiota bacterium]